MIEKEPQPTSGIKWKLTKIILGLAVAAGGAKQIIDAFSIEQPFLLETERISQQLDLIKNRAIEDGGLTEEELAQIGQVYLDLDNAEIAYANATQKVIGRKLLGAVAFTMVIATPITRAYISRIRKEEEQLDELDESERKLLEASS